MQEAEIRRITTPGQTKEKVHKTPSQQKKAQHGGACLPSYSGKPKIEGQQSKPAWAKSKTLYAK
jgi:hypothetical protein